MSKIKYFKLNEEDILEIVSEYLAETSGYRDKCFETQSIMFGTPSEDLRMIVAVGKSHVSSVDLEEVDRKMDYNGEHSKAHGLTNEELSEALSKMASTGEF